MVCALRALIPPRSSVLPPADGSEAKKALNAALERANKGEKGYLERTVLDRHMDTSTITRHNDGDSAAIQSIRGWHGSRSLRVNVPKRNGRGIRTTVGCPTVVLLPRRFGQRYFQRCPASRTRAELAMVISAMRIRSWRALKVTFMVIARS